MSDGVSQRLCAELDPDVSTFWTDTLLVPLVPHMRRLAISRMASIYRNAKAMIVLDHDLSTVQGSRTSRALQAALCDWITRLWTFQEGRMALYKTFFAFKDRLVPIYELSQGLWHLDTLSEILIGPYHPVRLGKPLLWSLGEAERFEANRRGDLMELAESLQMRSTTRASDEAICLATMLGLDVLKLPLRPSLEDICTALRTTPCLWS
ncbi:hypothetical protein EJ03DRAFT_91578 [Teratosphaeria nubilosa]|uniref:Heterokaryon incompatibility domain-containing protein n=1 Tax=Teratosphaeria nubilosa TaxID=161662 RepID=A0A6G1LA01_9PEZI|nr:hypothetical protein EJ03DRAFT_91578 [Teratosphaeria nubilosa]